MQNLRITFSREGKWREEGWARNHFLGRADVRWWYSGRQVLLATSHLQYTLLSGGIVITMKTSRPLLAIKTVFKLHSLVYRSDTRIACSDSIPVTHWAAGTGISLRNTATKRRVPRQKRADSGRNLIALFSHHASLQISSSSLRCIVKRYSRSLQERDQVGKGTHNCKTLNHDNTLSYQLLAFPPLPPTPPKWWSF